MTPLAQDFTNDLLLLKHKRRWDDGGLGFGINSFHFFETTAVYDAAIDLAVKFSRVGIPGNLAFLPADQTWIEFKPPQGPRAAILLERDGDVARVRLACADREQGVVTPSPVAVPLRGNAGPMDLFTFTGAAADLPEAHDFAVRRAYLAYAFLAMINTPRVIGRRQHMPHRGLEKRLVAERGMVGKFPLRAWTEIVLEVRPPQVDESDPREAHFTGTKALHFVRCHLRLVNGALSLVSPHWRGDPALGIMRSRYRLEPATARAA